MKEGTDRVKNFHSDKIIETIRRASTNMDMDDYANATGLDKEFIFRILKGEVENVDMETYERLSLKH